MRKRYWKKYFQMMGIAVGSTVGICQPTLLLAGDVSLSDDLSLSSALSVQYGGTETVDGNGYTIYGNNNSGYFVHSGSLTINDATLTGFTTTGGSGSGGGAGLGGAIFVNDGASVTLNNVSFGGNAAIGGVGGVGSTGGSLNNLFNSGTAGATGENGEDSAGGTSYVNGGNGGNGYNGADGGDGATGVGGAGGSGGDGSDGSAITADTIKSAVDLVYDAFMATGDGTAAGLYTAIAASFTAQAAAATAGGVTAGLAPGYTALAASFTTLAAEAGGVATEDLVKLAADTAYDIAITVTAFELGIAGNGGGAGNGGNGGNGAFGYGGGTGGNGGDGGDAVSTSNAVGGAGGDGGSGGNGGFGAGGGLGGSGGSAGSDGDDATNAAADGAGGDGGSGGFGAGNGSTADGSASGVGGDGGSGYGGSIFVNSGGTLNINGTSTFNQGHVFGGGSENGGDSGEGVGTDLFMMKGSTVNLNAGDGVITFNGTIADDSKASIGESSIPDGQGASVNVNSGLVIFNGANTYSGRTNLNGGVLQAWDGEGLYTNSNLNFNGGVFQTSGTFDRYTGTAAYQVQWTGSGGFAAVDDPLYVQLNGGGTLTWGSNSFVPDGSSLIFGSSTATDDVTFANKINLAGGNRSILVAANDDNTDRAILTGVISNGALTVGDATHDGILALTAANTYAGGTTIANGTLALKNTASLNANGAMAIASPGVFDISQTGDQAIGNLSGDGTANLGDNTLTINQAGNTAFSGAINDGGIGGGTGASVTKTGAGTLTLSGANTYTGTTEIAAGTLNLTGSLDSRNVHIAAGATLDDVNGGLHSASTLSNDGTVNLSADDAVAAFASTGTLNGSSRTLTAATYALNNGSIINANLGSGAVTANGAVQLNGTSDAETFHVQTGTTTLGAAERLLNSADLTIDALATLILGGAEKIGSLFGAGVVNVTAGEFTVDDGNFSGVIAGTNPAYGLTKVSSGVLALSGASTYTGATEITGGTLNLTGSLDSGNVHVSAGTILNDVNGGLHATSALSNDGTINLSADDAVAAFANTGTLNGSPYTLTAATYALNNGSIINANLGSGVVTANGAVQLNGASSAETFHVQTGTTTLGAAERLLDSTDLTVDALATLILGGAEKIGSLFGAGVVNVNAGEFTIDDGNFSGVVNGASAANGLTKVSSGALTLSGANTYAGPTNVNAGTLDLTGSLTGSVVNVAGGATLNDVAAGLADGTVLTANGTVNLSADETIDQLFGSGSVHLAAALTVSSGDFSGVVSADNATYELFKVSSGTLTLSGANTYTGATETAAGTLNLTGSLDSQNVHVASGATLNDVNGGLHSASTLSNDGTVNLSADDAVAAFANTGTLNGSPYTLTAAAYALNNGSIINANLGSGVVTANGAVQLNGASGAEIVNIASGTTTLGSAERLLDSADVTISSLGMLVLGGDETIGTLLGGGIVDAHSYQLILTEGGNFSGTINNAADLIAYGSELNINGGVVNTESFGISNGGVINLNGSTVNANDVNILDGILNVNSGSSLNSSENVYIASGAAVVMEGTGAITGIVLTVDGNLEVLDGNALNYDLLNGSGTVGHAGAVFVNNLNETVGGNLTFLGDFANYGVLSPGNSPGVVAIAGDYTESGTLQIELQTTTPATGHDQVRVGGATTLASGSTLVAATYGGALPLRGNEYQIISDLDGNAVRVNGVFDTVAFDADGISGTDNAATNAAVVFDLATGRLTATGLNAANSAFADLGGNANQRAAAVALFNAAQVASNQIDTDTLAGTLAHQIIDAQGTPSGDLAHYTPTFYGAMADYTFTGARALSRLGRKDRLAPAGRINDRANIYVGGLLNEATSGDDSDVSRHDYYLGGEYAVSPKFSVGALISKNDGDIESALGSDDVTGGTGQMYMRTALTDAFELSGSFSYSQTDNDLQRSTMQGHVKGSSDVSAYTGALGVAYKSGVAFGGAVVVPSLDVYYSSADMDGFNEHGAVDALNNSGTTADELTARIGATATWNTSISGRSFSFEINPAIEQVISGDSGSIALQMNSLPEVKYSIDYIDRNKTTEIIGVNVGYALLDNSMITVGYEGRFNDQLDSQINAKLTMSF